jgi:hypothetical protein
VSPDDTLPCSSVPPSADSREERAKVAYQAYWKSFAAFIQGRPWDSLPPDEQEAWRCAAEAAYQHIVIDPPKEDP